MYTVSNNNYLINIIIVIIDKISEEKSNIWLSYQDYFIEET